MAFKLRSVNTKFWEDPFIENLRPEEKLLFLYLLTNPLTNMIGIYEISIKRMSYDTGLTIERVEKALKAFNGKVVYLNDYILLPNFLKNQNLNTNMKTGAMKIYDELPNWLRDSINDKPLEAFESLRNAMLNMKFNMNSNNEVEVEDEEEDENNEGLIFPFDSEEFLKWWNLWKEYKHKEHKFKYKSSISEQAALKKVSELAGGDELKAISILEQSMAQGWAGLFELTVNNNKQYNNDPATRAAMREKIGAEFARKWKK